MAVVVSIGQISLAFPFLSLELQQTQDFITNIHGVTRKITLDISPQLYDFYDKQEYGNGVVHMRTSNGVEDQFSSSGAVGSTFTMDIVLIVNRELIGVRGWQGNLTFNPSLLSIESWSFGNSLWGTQQIVANYYKDNNNGVLIFFMVSYIHATSVPSGTYVLGTATWKVKASGGTCYFAWDKKSPSFQAFTGCWFAQEDESDYWDSQSSLTVYHDVRWVDAFYGVPDTPNELSGLGALPLDPQYARFIAPKIFVPFCTELRQVYPDDEDYVNAVMQIIEHEAYSYAMCHYAIVAMGRGWTDCDGWSITVATLLKAAGIDTVLFCYLWGNMGHMNLGVKLSHRPTDCMRTGSYSVSYNGQQWWMLECTGEENVRQGGASGPGWKVGEAPTQCTEYGQPIFIGGTEKYNPNLCSPYPLVWKIENTAEPTTYSLTIQSSGGGSTKPIAGDYTYSKGSSVSVEAVPDMANGWTFKNWLLDSRDAGTSNPIVIDMSESHMLQPQFQSGTAGNSVVNFIIVRNSKPCLDASAEITYTGGFQRKSVDGSGTASFTVPKPVGKIQYSVTYGAQERKGEVSLTQDTINMNILFNAENRGGVLPYTWLSTGLAAAGIVVMVIPIGKPKIMLPKTKSRRKN